MKSKRKLASLACLVALVLASLIMFVPSTAPPIHASPDQATYDYSDRGSGDNAWEDPDGQVGSAPGWTPTQVVANGTEATGTDYTALASSDDSRWTTDGATDPDYDIQYYRFTISEDSSDVDNFTVTYEGFGEAVGGGWVTVYYYIYDNTNGTWDFIDSQNGSGSDVTLSLSDSTDIDNYINSDGELWTAASAIGNPAASCPIVYTWDGAGWVGGHESSPAGGLGYPYSGGFQQPSPSDWISISTNELTADNLVVLIREEQNEVTYIDSAVLYGVMHASGTELYSSPVKWYFGARDENIHTAASPVPPLHAYIENGENQVNILPYINAPDDNWTLYGTENHNDQIVLDFGDLGGAKQVKLLVRARTNWVDAAGIEIWPPYAEVWTGAVWQRVGERKDSWFDTTFWTDRIYCVDITNWFADLKISEYKLRINDWQSKSYDYFAVDTSLDNYTLTTIPLTNADLRHTNFIVGGRGTWEYSKDHMIYTDGYPLAAHHAGAFTKTGDMTPLLTSVDDMYVIMRVGDEIGLQFATPKQKFDSYLLMTDAYYKPSWIRFFTGQKVNLTTPLPFHAMSNYPYPENENYPTDPTHLAYIQNYLTREVTPILTPTLGCIRTDRVHLVVNYTPAPPPSNPPTKPVLSKPDNQSSWEFDNNPTFEWTIGDNAENQYFILDDDSDFSSILENVKLADNTENTYTPVLLADNYYWKIIAVNTVGENESDVGEVEFKTPWGTWWDTNYPYRIPLKFGPRLDNYQFKLDRLDSTDNFNSHLAFENLMDTRFLDNDLTVLDHWIENDNIAWVRIPNNETDNLIWCYYGYVGAVPDDNGENTFIFFDDFIGDNLRGDKWATSSGAPTVTNSVVTCEMAGGVTEEIVTFDDFAPPHAMRQKARLSSAALYSYSGLYFTDGAGGDPDGYAIAMNRAGTYYNTDTYVESPAYDQTHTTSVALDAWVVHEVKATDDSQRHYINEDLQVTHEAPTWPTLMLNIKAYSNNGAKVEVDWIFLRKYAATEPVMRVGDEQSAPVVAEWTLIETWTGTVEAPATWQLIETWTGTVQAPAEWQLIETWTGTVVGFAEWNLIETWSGTIEAPAGWQLVETWTGTVQSPSEVLPTQLKPYAVGVAILVPFFIVVGSICTVFVAKKRKEHVDVV